MTGVLIKWAKVDTDRHTGRTPCKHEGRDQGDASINQGMPNIASKLPEVRGGAGKRFSFIVFGRNQPCQHLGLLVSRTVRQYTSVV